MGAGGAITPAIDFGAPAPSTVAIEGKWERGAGWIEFKGPGSGAITIANTASNVRVRMSAAAGKIAVGVREDGPPLDREWAGTDCHEDPDRGAATEVDSDREYWIVRRKEPEFHELTFEIDRPGLRIHSARFE